VQTVAADAGDKLKAAVEAAVEQAKI
jgi:hypothetical protein